MLSTPAFSLSASVPLSQLLLAAQSPQQQDSAAVLPSQPEHRMAALASARRAALLETKLKVHPSVVLSILDHYARRPLGKKRVIGTLLGVAGLAQVELNECYGVPHEEKGDDAPATVASDISFGKEYQNKMRALHARSSPNDSVVGWYTTSCQENGVNLDANMCMVHDYYSTECGSEPPVLLVLDVPTNGSGLALRAFRCAPLALSATRALVAEFRPIAVEIVASEVERVGLDALRRLGSVPRVPAPLPHPAQTLEQSMERLLSMLDTVSAYVESVVNGRVLPDPKIGRMIADLVNSVPNVSPEAFANGFTGSLQDLLMVSYLSNLTRAQIAIAEQLGSVM